VKKTIPEQIAAFEATRAAKSARMSEIMEKASDEGVTLDAAQTEEYDTLETEVKSVDEHLVRLRGFEQVNKAAAKPVDGATDTKQASEIRGGVVTSVKSNLPKGTAFTRYAISLMRSQGNLMQAVEIAKQWHDTTPEVETVLRAAVAAGTTTDARGPVRSCSTRIWPRVRGAAASADDLGRLNGLRNVPFNVRIPSQTGGSTAYWVGEGAPKPVSALSFATTTMGFAKVADVVVMTNELVRFSSPSAEQLVRDDLTAQIAQFLDIAFIDPTKAAVAGVSPASVTNGLGGYADRHDSGGASDRYPDDLGQFIGGEPKSGRCYMGHAAHDGAQPEPHAQRPRAAGIPEHQHERRDAQRRGLSSLRRACRLA
jgi:HK97 family phage major capsid protein